MFDIQPVITFKPLPKPEATHCWLVGPGYLQPSKFLHQRSWVRIHHGRHGRRGPLFKKVQPPEQGSAGPGPARKAHPLKPRLHCMGPFYDVTGPLWSPYFFEFPQKIIHFSALFGNPKESRMPQDFFCSGFSKTTKSLFWFFSGIHRTKNQVFFGSTKILLRGFPNPDHDNSRPNHGNSRPNHGNSRPNWFSQNHQKITYWLFWNFIFFQVWGFATQQPPLFLKPLPCVDVINYELLNTPAGHCGCLTGFFQWNK